jgi:hypothetical protein
MERWAPSVGLEEERAGMTTVSVEVILKDSEAVRVEQVVMPHGAPGTWGEAAVRDVLIEMLRAIDRVRNPGAPRDRPVSLIGFNWIVEPISDGVMLALLIPTGTAAVGPLAIDQGRLDTLITNVIKDERRQSSATTVH